MNKMFFKSFVFVFIICASLMTHAAQVVTPLSFDFESVLIGTEENTLYFTITNQGPGAATGCSAPVLAGSDDDQFTIQFDSCRTRNLAVGESCVVHIGAKPTGEGLVQAHLERDCSVGGTASTTPDGISARGTLELDIDDSDFEGSHGVWTQVNSGQIAFTGGVVEISEGASKASISQELTGLTQSTYYYKFEVKNTSSYATEAIIFGSYVLIEAGFSGVKEGPVFTSMGTSYLSSMTFYGPQGLGSGEVIVDNIRVFKMQSAALNVPDGDFQGSHGVWDVNDPSLVDFNGTQALLSTDMDFRGEMGQTLPDVENVGRTSFYVYSFDAENLNPSSASANILGNYLDIAPGVNGVKKGVVKASSVGDESIIEFASPLQYGASSTMILDDVAIDRLVNPPAGMANITKLVSGPSANHTCALFDNKRLRCWGLNTYGQLGRGASGNVGDDEHPVFYGDIQAGGDIVDVAVGGDHTCALFDDGKVKCWGYNASRQLGYGDTTHRGLTQTVSEIPYVNLGTTAKQIVTGLNHTCALLTSGSLKCWGYNSTGQLGLGNTSNITTTPNLISAVNITTGGEVIDSIAAGSHHTCALLTNGTFRCFGSNSYGQLGLANGGTNNVIGDNEHPSSKTAQTFSDGIESLHLGGNHSCALLSDGNVKCWGKNLNGELGQGNKVVLGDDEALSTISAINLGGSLTALKVSAGYTHTCLVLNNDESRCFGLGTYGRLGQGSTQDLGDNETVDTISAIDIGGDAIQVVAGNEHSCVLIDKRKPICFGRSNFGQLGLGNVQTIGDDELPYVGSPVLVRGIVPTADFDYVPSTGTRPLTVNFDASDSLSGYILGKITSYVWDFGDGEVGTGKFVEHTFDNSGDFRVKLTVTNELGISNVKTASVTVNDREMVVVNEQEVELIKNGNYFTLASDVYRSDGSFVTSSVEWISDNPSIATVNSSGRVSPVNAGVTSVKARFGTYESEPVRVEVYEADGTLQVMKGPAYFSSRLDNTLYGLATAQQYNSITSPDGIYSASSYYNDGSFTLRTQQLPGLHNISIKETNQRNNATQSESFSVRTFDGNVRGLLYDGSNDRAVIKLAQSFGTGSFTIGMWFKLEILSTTNLMTLASSSGSFQLGINSRATPFFSMSANAGKTFAVVGSRLNNRVGQWIQITVTYDSSTQLLKLYQNGLLQSTNLVSETPYYPVYSSTHSLGATNFKGVIDQVYFLEEALEASDIEEDLFQEPDAENSNMHFSFNLNQIGQELTDQSGNGGSVILGQNSLIETSDPISRFSSYIVDQQVINAASGGALGAKGYSLEISGGTLDANTEVSMVLVDTRFPGVWIGQEFLDSNYPGVWLYPRSAKKKSDASHMTLRIPKTQIYANDKLAGLKVGDSDNTAYYVPNRVIDDSSKYASFSILSFNPYYFGKESVLPFPTITYNDPLFSSTEFVGNSEDYEFFNTTLVKVGSGPFNIQVDADYSNDTYFNSSYCRPAGNSSFSYFNPYSQPMVMPGLKLGMNDCYVTYYKQATYNWIYFYRNHYFKIKIKN